VVSVDNRNGAKQAVQHLYKQGKRKIGIITGPMVWWEAVNGMPAGRKQWKS